MHIPIVLVFVVLQCTLCLSIRVPVDWGDDSEVYKDQQLNTPKNEEEDTKLIPNEYFQYPAKKPQFAIEIAANNGVQSPENLYKSYPIIPNTGPTKQQFEEQRIQDPQNNILPPYQRIVHSSGDPNFVKPATTSFEVHHPYKSEEPALKQLYKDPIFENIRNGLKDKNRILQKYQNEAGKLDVTKDEYLEKPEQIDHKKQIEKNVPAQFEVHNSQRQPAYFRYPPNQNHREILNHKLKHPWNQNIGQVTPKQYHPIKNHLHGLRQKQALKYDDENNEYPQLPPQEDDDDKPEGYDIYEKGNAKFIKFKGQVDDAINKVEQDKRPHNDRKLESLSQTKDYDESSGDDEDEFVPIKNYAQVRKTEITKHLPREAALEDAESFEEILNAPRLREAIKSKKAQIVYSEEGYEDSAYDHGKEQKHASDHERHGGYLKKNEISNGKYKTPSYSSNYNNAEGLEHRDQVEHGEKWNNDLKENENENNSDYYESQEGTDDSDEENIRTDNNRNRRNSEDNIDDNLNEDTIARSTKHDLPFHEVTKRETLAKVPQNTTDVTTILNSTEKSDTINNKENIFLEDDIKRKYPYYFKNLKLISKNSPIRYATNFELIPKKSNGGSEFYDSRSAHECAEVEDNVDPLPEKLKKDGHPDDDENADTLSNDKAEVKDKFKSLKNTQRLKGLGDKIDCFKTKYFGQNPLDSPFFNEDIIENPEPVTKPNLEVFDFRQLNKLSEDKLPINNSDIFSVLEKLRLNENKTNKSQFFDNRADIINITNNHSQSRHSKNFITKLNTNDKRTSQVRSKRAAPFTYEPYKIIRDGQISDSKKTTTTGNISPLIKQLQSSRVIDKVTYQDKDQAIKKNHTRLYKDIGKIDRQENRNDQTNNLTISSFVDVNTDQRRGEPKYEIRPANHKSQYSSVENKKAISVADFKVQTGKDNGENKSKHTESTTQAQHKRSKRRKPTTRPYFDVSKYLPKTIDVQQIAASNTVRKVIITTTSDPPTDRTQRQKTRQFKDKVFSDYNDDEEEDEIITTSTTPKSNTRKRTRGTTTTSIPIIVEEQSESPKLHLHTRFREYQPHLKNIPIYETTEPSSDKIYNEENSPKFTEKKRKSSKSTLVTDSESYGEGDDDDTRKKEVDELIGVKQDMDEYIPLYERVVNKINRMKNENENKRRDHVYDSDINTYNDNINKDKYHIHDDDDDDDDDEDDNDEDDNNEDIEEDEDENEDENNDDHEDEDEENEEDDSNRHHDARESYIEATTSEPTKRTLVKTTEAPATTTEARSAKLEFKPIVLKKKIEIHNEIPVNKSSPHVTQFKQDIKEIEIIKEMSPKFKTKSKGNKNIEALDLYRDEKLAEEINKLGDVEVFRENLDLKSGPRHGGNYRSITPEELEKEKKLFSKRNKDDVDTSQTETRELVELDADIPLSRSRSYSKHSSPQINNEERNAKFVELRDTTSRPRLHGGNLKLPQSREQRRKSEKYVDIDEEEEEEEEPSSMHGGNFKSYGNSGSSGRRMHGGNYRSAKLVAKSDEEKQTRRKSKDDTIRTTTPIYILDPSKRMYYYVDA